MEILYYNDGISVEKHECGVITLTSKNYQGDICDIFALDKYTAIDIANAIIKNS